MAVLKGPNWSNYHRLNLSKDATKGIQYGLDARRALVFFFFFVAGRLPLLDSVGRAPNVPDQPGIDTWRATRFTPDVLSPADIAPNVGVNSFTPSGDNSLSDYVSIIDMDSQRTNLGYEVIKLVSVPRELNWNSESVFAAIKPLGRNSAFYHYTGSEDKLEFEIDWYSTSWDSREVIKNCRRVEALTKADGYTGNPHRVMLKWGVSNVLFEGIYFQMIAAPYRMTQFNKGRRGSDGSIERTHMLPVQAYQTVTLARIDEINTTFDQIKHVS